MYINKKIIKCLATKIISSSFNVIEYREKETSITNNSSSLKPEIECMSKKEECGSSLSKICTINDESTNIGIERERRYITFNDITEINNLSFYYNIIENINVDRRVRNNSGIIEKIDGDFFYIKNEKYIVHEKSDIITELFENNSYINILCYRINNLERADGIYEIIAIYIE